MFLKKSNSKYISLISILNFLVNINNFINDILLFYFVMIGISNFNNENTNYVFRIVMCLWVLQLLIEFMSLKNYRNVKVSKSLLGVLVLYGALESIKSNDFLLLHLYLINRIIRQIIILVFERESFALNKKGILLHELGHFFISKEYKILNPELIEVTIKEYSLGRLITNGNIEDVNPFKYITMLLSGYITENYILYDKKEYDLTEIRRILLIELGSNQYSNNYLGELVKIYLDDNKLEEAIADILKIIDKYKNDILNMAKKNRYKKTIDLKEYVEG